MRLPVLVEWNPKNLRGYPGPVRHFALTVMLCSHRIANTAAVSSRCGQRKSARLAAKHMVRTPPMASMLQCECTLPGGSIESVIVFM